MRKVFVIQVVSCSRHSSLYLSRKAQEGDVSISSCRSDKWVEFTDYAAKFDTVEKAEDFIESYYSQNPIYNFYASDQEFSVVPIYVR